MHKKIKMKPNWLIILLILYSSCGSKVGDQKPMPNKQTKNGSLIIDDGEAVFTIVTEMPRFPGCEDEEYKKNCSDQKFLKYLYSNIKYNAVAQENHSIGSKQVFSFIIEKDGSLSNFEFIKGAESNSNLREVVEGMSKWIPGNQKGVNKRVRMHIPMHVHWK